MSFWRRSVKPQDNPVVSALKDQIAKAERDKEAARLNLQRSMKKLEKMTFDDQVMSMFGRSSP